MKGKTVKKIALLCCITACSLSVAGSSVMAGTTANPVIRAVVENENYASLNDVEFWGTYSTEKVLQDNVTMYDDIKKEAKLSVAAIGGEEEAYQIIMTAGDKDVKEYDVVLSDLQSASGQTFAKENIKVYHERYINVGAAGEYYTTAGYFPDCLVPFERVKAVKETGFKANNNQGLYVSFDVPEAQAAGTYSGSMQIVIGGESKSIPITLRVVAGSITAETHVKSSFLNEWYFYRGELNTTEEMYEAYNQKLFEYRLGCNDVVVYTKDVDFYAETVCRYAKQLECPGYNIPWRSKSYAGSGYVLNGRELSFAHSYDVDYMLLYLRTIAYKGLEENVDPFKKAFIYGWDEPDLNFGVEGARIAVKEWSYIVKQCKLIVMEELKADSNIENQELLAEILTSLEAVPHLVLSSTFLDNDIDLTQEDCVYGPEFQHLESEGVRDKYRLSEDNDLWWYGCVEPDYPYPTYHIDDTLLSARLESWMKNDYNIQGNLYWATCLYSEPNGADGTMIYPEDLYSGTAARSLSTNGEGFLFYPGKKYGLDEPLPSIRLEQIRDGLEEYEMLYKMAEIYASVGEGYVEDNIMRYIYDTMYSGTMINTTSEIFANAREALLSLFELACSPAQVCVTNVVEGAGAYQFEVFAKDGYALKQAGKDIVSKRSVNGGYLYTFSLNLNEGEILDLSVDVNGQTLGFAMSFGTSATNYGATYLTENNVIRKRNIAVTTEVVSAQDVFSGANADEQWIQLKLAEATTSKQDFLLVDDNVIKKLSVDANKLVIRIYNASADNVSVELLMEYGKSLGSYTRYKNYELQPGMNVISINNINGMRWDNWKYINRIRITVGEKGDAKRDYLYFVDMSVYK